MLACRNRASHKVFLRECGKQACHTWDSLPLTHPHYARALTTLLNSYAWQPPLSASSLVHFINQRSARADYITTNLSLH